MKSDSDQDSESEENDEEEDGDIDFELDIWNFWFYAEFQHIFGKCFWPYVLAN